MVSHAKSARILDVTVSHSGAIQPKPACLLAPEENFLAPKWLQVRTQGTQKHQKMILANFFHDFLGTAKFWAQKIHLLLPCTPLRTNFWLLVMSKLPAWLLGKLDVMAWLEVDIWEVQKVSDRHFIVPQVIMDCHIFTLNGSFCMLIYARTCNIFVVLTRRSNSGIKKELIAHFSVFLANC